MVSTVYNPDFGNVALQRIRNEPENILSDGTNLVDYTYGETATYVDETGAVTVFEVCAPVAQKVTMKGLIGVIFPRKIEPITDVITQQIRDSNVIQMTVVKDSDLEAQE